MSVTPELPDQLPNPSTTVSEFFRITVRQLLEYNIEFVLSSTYDHRRNVQSLALVDKPPVDEEPDRRPPRGVPIDYHFVYESYDTERQVTTSGIYIAKPRLRRKQGENLPKWGDSRHYFDAKNGRITIVRRDTISDHYHPDNVIEFIDGESAVDPQQVRGFKAATTLNELLRDIDIIHSCVPVRPMTNLFDSHVTLNVPRSDKSNE